MKETLKKWTNNLSIDQATIISFFLHAIPVIIIAISFNFSFDPSESDTIEIDLTQEKEESLLKESSPELIQKDLVTHEASEEAIKTDVPDSSILPPEAAKLKSDLLALKAQQKEQAELQAQKEALQEAQQMEKEHQIATQALEKVKQQNLELQKMKDEIAIEQRKFVETAQLYKEQADLLAKQKQALLQAQGSGSLQEESFPSDNVNCKYFFGGIGVDRETYSNGTAKVVQIFNNYPAQRAGLQVGDFILNAHGITGKIGTIATLKVRKVSGVIMLVPIKRAKICTSTNTGMPY